MKSPQPFGFLSDAIRSGEYCRLREQLKAELEKAFEIASTAAPSLKGPDDVSA